LTQWHPLFLSMPLESVIKEQQSAYYQALEAADQASDSTPFIEFMLAVIAQTLLQNAPVSASVNAPVNIKGMKTPEALLHLLHHNPHLTRQQLADLMAKDVRTIARALAKLQAVGKLKRIGSDKTGHWEAQL
jgi:predicted HTH transcriptional regulator